MGFIGRGLTDKAHLIWDLANRKWVSSPQAFNGLQFGAGTLTASATTRYLAPGNIATAPTTIKNTPVVAAGIVRKMAIWIDTPGVGATVVTYELFKNGVATGILVSGPATATNLSVTANLPVLATDRLAIQVRKAAAVTVGDIAAVVSIGEP